MKCKFCKIPMGKGTAIQNTLVAGLSDFIGDTDNNYGQTMHYGGPGKLIPCWKCPECGYSVMYTEKGNA